MATTTAQRPDKSFARWQLANRLRQLREQAGLSLNQAAIRLRKDRTTLSRTESGEYEIEIERVTGLCHIYGVTDSRQIRALTQMAEATARNNGFLDSYGIEDWFGLYAGAEREASALRVYQPNLIPGPFQTADYVRAVCEAGHPPSDEEKIRQQVELRLERQQHLLRPEAPPHVRVVLGACALARPVGGREVMAAQLAHLAEISQRDSVDLRVVPVLIGAHPSLARGPFTILDFPDEPDPSIVYLEGHTGAQYLDRQQELAAYGGLFAAVWDVTVPLQEYLNGSREMGQIDALWKSG